MWLDSSPFKCINLLLQKYRSSVFVNQMLIHLFIRSFVRSFVGSLIAQKSIQGNVQNCHKEEEEKRGKEVRLESERRGKENVSGIGIHSLARYHSKESDNITYERGPIFDLQILRQTFISSIL